MQPDWEALLALPPAPERAEGAPPRRSVGGLFGGSLGLVLAVLAPRDGPCLVLHPDAEEADDLFGDLALFGVARERRLLFPPLEDDERGHDRMAVLERLRRERSAVVIASYSAATQPAPEPAELDRTALRLAPGRADLGPEELARRLAEAGWERVSLVTGPGEFSVRGDLVDLAAPGLPEPLRLEFFGDELESVRAFDPETQRATRTLDSVEFAVRPASGAFADLLAHFPPPAPVFRIDPALHEAAPGAGRPGADLNRLREGDLLLRVQQVEPVGTGAEALRARIVEAAAGMDRTYFACRNEAEETRVRTLLGEEAPGLSFLRGRLSRSFRLPDRRLAVLGYDDLLQHLTRRRPAPKRPREAARALDDFLDLEPGDMVVHVAHGIGIFRGMQVVERAGARVEHCVVEFRDDVRVHVPVSKIDLIQKYVGAPGGRPRLGRVGGTAWAKSKERVQRAVTDLAARLLDVQALRRERPGIAFPPDDALQHEFEASFPYEETPDQLAAMEAIKADMEAPRPMDRLLCGDVGYGKTELAMRAVFKAVLGGKQAAVLVPTTVLAAQHFTTFSERMAGYPVRIEMLSRFRSDAEARAIADDLAEGKVDVLIGTHRILSPSIRFRDLGLVVIDEEQRFGVEHKERLKSLRATVDVLTMTATPIPRTLNLALLGLRDISNLTTPPEGRMPVHTEVRRFDEGLVRDWLVRELRRGGQVYFVHNRIETIHGIDRLAASLVPSARRAVVHGRMPRHALEESMMAFVRGEIDVLVTTTIIESGLDIPNANTLIVDRAHHIGLADLHQLRGRVGRGRHRAYALFLLPREHLLVSEIAERRLRTIEEHSELGAGFRIALKDLEIRGAGNILGGEQSGHIAEVGYELYCRLLEKAVRALRHEPVPERAETFVDLAVEAYLPDRYVGDAALKLGFYRRIAAAADEETLRALEEELSDRCGKPPPEARRLFDVARLRIVGERNGIQGFSMEKDGTLQIRLADPPRALDFLRRRLGRSLRVPSEGLAVIAEPVRPPDGARALETLLKRL